MIIHATLPGGDGPRTLELKGRVAWALLELSAAGKRGLTVIERPAMRWAAYVHSLRRMGFSIETELEPHGGDFAGHHARYRLHTDAMLQVIRWRGTW